LAGKLESSAKIKLQEKIEGWAGSLGCNFTMRETRGQILDGASVALCRRDMRQLSTKPFPFRPAGKGAKR
jgi:hypothetical protein